ncbi:hypothetical protein RDWZM_004414 [Blomia tropicalis]|uniref:Non-specific serine/threonine protein kinase n=1 Tax=Blomia tropicalis TaxID=40697 RepID=A0A9Q0MHE5_BLOTA|nr:hypothetical protein RDWZM_004414 [Blomia tropicalis]
MSNETSINKMIIEGDGTDDENDFEGKLLHQSCLWDNSDLLSDLLFGDELQNINSQDSKGRTALHAAVISNSVKCARLLLMNGADVNIRNRENGHGTNKQSGKTCLHIAAERGLVPMMQILLEFDVDIYAKDTNGFTAMDLAEQHHHQPVIDLLKNVLVMRENQRTDLYESLAIAVHKGEPEAVRRLLVRANQFGIECQQRDKLMMKTNHNPINSLVNYAPNGSNTLLFKACQEGHLEIVQLLIEAGSDGRQHPVTRYSPLYIASYHGRKSIVQLLLEHFPELAAIYTVEHWLPIHAAAMNNHLDIVKLLLNHSYPRKVMRKFVCRSDHVLLAINESNDSKINSTDQGNRGQYIYSMAFDVNAQDIAGQSLLYLAALLGNQALVEFLLNYRLMAISYNDYSNGETLKNSHFELIDSRQQLNYLFGDEMEPNDEDVDEDDFCHISSGGNSSSGSSTSPDITVISPIDRNKSSQINRSSISPIQRLIDKLSPPPPPSTSPTSKQTKCSTTTNKSSKIRHLPPLPLSTTATKTTATTNVQRATKYKICPFQLDLLCNYNMETALHCSVKKRHYSIASLLLESGSNPNLSLNLMASTNPSIITRVSHFNHHNCFLPPISITSGGPLWDRRQSNPTASISTTTSATSDTDSNKSETKSDRIQRSTALREAVRNRDRAMVDLLLRFGARDDDDYQPQDDDDEDDIGGGKVQCNALAIALGNNDFHFVSRLLSLKAHADDECKINKRSFDLSNSNCMNSFNKFTNNITVSSMFPIKSVMIDWHQLGIKSLDNDLQNHLSQWLIDSALMFNIKLKLGQSNQTAGWNTALAAITRIDLSSNGLTSLPICLFTDLPSLKILNLSKNRLQTLPEVVSVGPDGGKNNLDDDCLVSLRRDQPASASSGLKSSSNFFSRMRKSQSVTAALSSAKNRGIRDSTSKSRASSFDEFSWNLPFLEELYLQDNQLECLPVSLFQQPELKQLDLSNNKLRTLPPLFWFAPKLTELNLSLNLLCDLPSPTQCQLSSNLVIDSNRCGSIESIGSGSTGGTSSTVRSSSTLMSKSISASSISDITKSTKTLSFDRGVQLFNEHWDQLNTQQYHHKSSQNNCNLTPFELNLSKPWLSKVNILNETYHGQLMTIEDELNKKTSIQLDTNMNQTTVQNCQLKQLNLSHNGFERIPVVLSCLANRLTHLNLSYNRLTTIFDPDYIIGHYPLTLKHLDLSHNQIGEWLTTSYDDQTIDDHKWFCCVHCSSSSSSSSMIPSNKSMRCPYKQHSRLDHLKTLVLTKNYLKVIVITRDELNHFQSSRLGGGGSPYGSVPSESKFRPFTTRSFSIDDLTFPETAATTENFNLNSKATRYSKLFFPSLSMLDMANNQLTEVPKTISYLSQLSVLNLNGNLELTTLPPEMGLLTKLWNLNTRGCLNLNEPLRSMIMSKTYKTCDIISYLNSILENSKPYTRMKLMIVGLQGIGKTSLLEQLRSEGTGRRHRTPDHWGKRMGHKSMGMKTNRGVTLSTVGVDLYEWIYDRRPLRGARDRSLSRTRMAQSIQSKQSLESDSIGPITFRTWDFGGQREYYATHQYFLSKRSIYLVVWKITDGEKGIDTLHQWLEYYPPFFSSELQNLIRERYMSDTVDADKRGLPKVVASVEVSAKTRHNIRLLANLIYETAVEIRASGNKERLLDQMVPATYLALEEIVTQMAWERKSAGLEPVVHSDQYRMDVVRMLKDRHNLTFRDYSELQQATRFLHENGVMLHYEDANLKDLYFLDPQWLCDILAHVVTIREINPFVKNALTWDNRTILIPSLLPTDEQLQNGHPGSDILIPLRSRLKMRSLNEPDCSMFYQFKNQLSFPELSYIIKKKQMEKEENCDERFSSICTITALARHVDSIHRLLLLSYVPCGFWSRLITRMVADESIIDIVRSFYHLPSSDGNENVISLMNNITAQWHCWQTGFALRYLDTFLLRVKEHSIGNGGLTSANSTSIIGRATQSKTGHQHYPYDYQAIKFYLGHQSENQSQSSDSPKSSWSQIYIAPQGSSMVEIYLPCQALQIDIQMEDETGSNGSSTKMKTYILEPNIEMISKLLVVLVEHIDTLLEDWYPSLDTNEPNQKMFTGNQSIQSGTDTILSPDAADIDSNLVDFYKSEVKKASTFHSSSSNKAESNDSAISTLKTTDITIESCNEQTLNPPLSLYHSVYAFMVEECILAVYEDNRLECPTHGRLRMEKIAPDVTFIDLKANFCIERNQLRFGKLLGRGSFGFVFRAMYTPKFSSSQSDSTFINRTVSNSKFYLPNQVDNESFEVALKLLQPIRIDQWSSGIRKADMEAYQAMKSKWERDPLQYACKAYCTARTELNILCSLKHGNIASILGICPKPLALVLTLAPQGSLDTHIRTYRRSGVRIESQVLQRSFLQISKALEYLHQHHIIYRDLKSENVLVWSFPSVSSLQSSISTEINLKLADYGISRSSLPTGTKGFGGTEGFMAPEIMLYNGEEEYTDKVDCFSFAMFMYELCTLRFPFEGQEFAIRESILDGIRPALSARDLQHLPESFVDLMVRCWAQEPNDRPTISQVVSIISAPEFCSLLDVAFFPENSSSLICAAAYECSTCENDSGCNIGICLSKVGKQIDMIESNNCKWNQIGHKLTSDNVSNRTITSVCIVNGRQLWLGDSQARLHVHDLWYETDAESTDLECNNGRMQLICTIQLQLATNPASLTAIKTICCLTRANLVAICSTSGHLWLLSTVILQSMFYDSSTEPISLTSNDLKMKEITNHGSMILSICHIDQNDSNNVEIWCGQQEGKISVVQIRPNDLFTTNQIVLDHYVDNCVKSTNAIYIGSNVSLDDRKDVLNLIASTVHPYVWSVLHTGFVIYQWDAHKRQILHRLDCSKLAPCSESLMSISIEDHFKPGSCQITTISCNDDNDELYVGTNSGCMIVAESGGSLKPITIFRPYNHEVKFILTIPEYLNNHTKFIDQSKTIIESEVQNTPQTGRNALRTLWPFNKSNRMIKDSRNVNEDVQLDIEDNKKSDVNHLLA